MELSKKQLKLIKSLRQKKYRQKHQLFVAEGVKVVNELLHSELEVYAIFHTKEYTNTIEVQSTIISDDELKKISNLNSPNKVLGVFKIPQVTTNTTDTLTLALDDINDPGNLGTIIRLCDWFGITQLICSPNTVDCYNPKVVQSTMGSLTRVQIKYTSISEFIAETSLPTYIADMNGDNVYQTQLPQNAIIIMGNEANGISDNVKEIVKNKLTIPRFGIVQKTESLNVATATAILLSEFRR